MAEDGNKPDGKKEEANPFSAFLRYKKGARSAAAEADNKETVGQFLYGSNFEDTSDDDIKQANWTSYTASRMAVRLFSRGIMGAGFYALGQAAVRQQLRGYHPGLAFNTDNFAQYPLRMIARSFDTVIAPPIKWFARRMPIKNSAVDREWLAENIVTFRNKTKFEGYQPTRYNTEGMGRSLGHEMVAITFDFAMGSVGDAWGRQIAMALDPNITNSWYKDGHFDPQQFVKAVGKHSWKIFSKNQGEDWFAALPYAYQMRWQRQAINRVSPGFKYLSDRGRTGWYVNPQGQITGSFAPANVLDLQLRFTGYNWYTLMYRDMYDELGDAIDDYRKEGALPSFHWPGNPLYAGVGMVAHSFRYVFKSAIKAAIYMTPAVPFFWMFRVPQGKYLGMGYHVADEVQHPGMRDASGLVMGPNGHPYNYFNHHQDIVNGGRVTLNGRELPTSSFNAQFYPHGRKASVGVLDKLLDPYGEFCYKSGRVAHRGLQRLGLATTQAHREYAHDLVNASLAYTPYMIAKAETALRWDKPTMDRAIYRFIDGLASLKLGEVRGALSDIREQITHPPTPRKVEEEEKADKQRFQREVEEESLLREIEEKKAASQRQPGKQVEQVQHEPRARRLVAEEATPPEVRDAAWQKRALKERFARELEPPPGTPIH